MNEIDNNTVLSEQTFLDFFNLKSENVESITTTRNVNGLNVAIKLLRKTHQCPTCSTLTETIKSYVNKTIKHQVFHRENCVIHYKARRYKCNSCNATFYENNPFTFKGTKLSLKTVYNILMDLKNPNETFKSIANRYYLSATTISSIFDRHVAISRKTLPKHLCIDEVYLSKGQYACVLVDFGTRNIVDIIPSRKKQDLLDYFLRIDIRERKNVELICMDFWETYRIISKSVLPNSKIVLDRFHIVQDFNRRITKARCRIMNKIKKDIDNVDMSLLNNKELSDFEKLKKEYSLLKKFNWLLFKSEPPNANAEKKYNKMFKQYMNYYDIYLKLLDIDPEINTMNNLVYYLSRYFKNSTYILANDELDNILNTIDNSGIPEVDGFTNLIRKWRKEVVNSFIVIDEKVIKVKDKKTGKMIEQVKPITINNGLAENRNRIIKEIKRNSNGISNFERFRNRIMYCINSDSTFHGAPIESVVKAKAERRNRKGTD